MQWYPNVLTESGLGVIRSGHFPACNLSCIQLVWRGLFALSWFHLNCNPKYTKTIVVFISKACTDWCWSTHTFEEQNWYPLQNIKLLIKAEFTENGPLAASCPAILSFQTGMDANLLNYTCLGMCGLLQSLQWCSGVGCKSLSFSSGITVWAVSTKFFQWCSSVPCKYSLGRPVVSQVYTGSTSGIPVYTGLASVHWLRVRVKYKKTYSAYHCFMT